MLLKKANRRRSNAHAELTAAIRNGMWAKKLDLQFIPSASESSVDTNWTEDQNKVAEKAIQEAVERRLKERGARGK